MGDINEQGAETARTVSESGDYLSFHTSYDVVIVPSAMEEEDFNYPNAAQQMEPVDFSEGLGYE